MNEKKNLLSSASSLLWQNKRYVVWFYLLNFGFAWCGASVFTASAKSVLDHSLYSDRLLHGFSWAAFEELLARPEFGPLAASTSSAMLFAVLFYIACLMFTPGVLLAYSSDHSLPREEFFRACGRNCWRFVRLLVFYAVIGGIASGILFGIQGALAGAADEVSAEVLPLFVALVGTLVVLIVLTAIRLWFDLAQTDAVLRDQHAVRKSVSASFRLLRHHPGRLLGSYLLIAALAALVLAGGIVLWNVIVPSASVFGGFLISQMILFFLLVMRFWQRAVAVSFYLRSAADSASEAERAFVPALTSTAP